MRPGRHVQGAAFGVGSEVNKDLVDSDISPWSWSWRSGLLIKEISPWSMVLALALKVKSLDLALALRVQSLYIPSSGSSCQNSCSVVNCSDGTRQVRVAKCRRESLSDSAWQSFNESFDSRARRWWHNRFHFRHSANCRHQPQIQPSLLKPHNHSRGGGSMTTLSRTDYSHTRTRDALGRRERHYPMQWRREGQKGHAGAFIAGHCACLPPWS